MFVSRQNLIAGLKKNSLIIKSSSISDALTYSHPPSFPSKFSRQMCFYLHLWVMSITSFGSILICTIPTYILTWALRLNFGFRGGWWTMASSRAGPYPGLWWTDALTQHIAVTLTPWATRRYAGSRAYDHHSRRKLTLMVPHFFVTFLEVCC